MNKLIGTINTETCTISIWKKKKSIYLEYISIDENVAKIISSQKGFFYQNNVLFRKIDSVVAQSKNLSIEKVGISLLNTCKDWPANLGIDYRWVVLIDGQCYWTVPGVFANNENTVLKSVVWCKKNQVLPEDWNVEFALKNFYKSSKSFSSLGKALFYFDGKANNKIPWSGLVWFVSFIAVLFLVVIVWTKPEKQLVVVPSLLNLSPLVAQQKLSQNKLKIKLENGQMDIVSEQTPGAGSLLKEDSVVTIKTKPKLK